MKLITLYEHSLGLSYESNQLKVWKSWIFFLFQLLIERLQNNWNIFIMSVCNPYKFSCHYVCTNSVSHVSANELMCCFYQFTYATSHKTYTGFSPGIMNKTKRKQKWSANKCHSHVDFVYFFLQTHHHSVSTLLESSFHPFNTWVLN